MFAVTFGNEQRQQSAPQDAKINVGCFILILEMNNGNIRMILKRRIFVYTFGNE